jgi:hypothetical protein
MRASKGTNTRNDRYLGSGVQSPFSPSKMAALEWSARLVRAKYIDFFRSKGHVFWPSSKVIPYEDPTLLFTNAGMNQVSQSVWGVSLESVRVALYGFLRSKPIPVGMRSCPAALTFGFSSSPSSWALPIPSPSLPSSPAPPTPRSASALVASTTIWVRPSRCSPYP